MNMLGVPIFTSNYLPEEWEEYEETEQLTTRQRWIEPILHPVTTPFEPWVKSRVVVKRRKVPCKSVFMTSWGMIISPLVESMILHNTAG